MLHYDTAIDVAFEQCDIFVDLSLTLNSRCLSRNSQVSKINRIVDFEDVVLAICERTSEESSTRTSSADVDVECDTESRESLNDVVVQNDKFDDDLC